MLRNQIKQTYTHIARAIKVGSTIAIGLASLLGTGLIAYNPSSIKANAAPVYSCPAGSVLVGTSCQSFTCADDSAPVGGNCAANQYGLSECNTAPAGATRVLLPYYQVAYGGGLCTTKPDLFRIGSCNAGGVWPEPTQSLGAPAGNTSYSTNGKYWWDPAVSAGTQWDYIHGNGTQGIAPLGRTGVAYGVGANFSAYIANNNWKPLINPFLDPNVYENNGQNYENVLNAFNQDALQNNMCTQYKIANIVCTIPRTGNVGPLCNQYKYTFERLGNSRACDPGYGVYMRPTSRGHSIGTTLGNWDASIDNDILTRGITSLCMKYGTPTAGLQSIGYSTGYRPKSCNSIGLVEVYGTDIDGGDQESDSLCIPGSPQPASAVGKTITTQATLTSNSPDGYLDGISNTGVASGWATDADMPNTPLDVHFYLDGTPTASGTYIGKTTASYVRPDLPAPYNTGNNGYGYKIPSAYCDGQYHTLTAYAIDVPAGTNNNTKLGGSPAGFTLTPAQCSTTITQSNIGPSNNCTTNNTLLVDKVTTNATGSKIQCLFPLSGSTANDYILPSTGIKGSINGATGTSGACVVDNFYQPILYRKVQANQTVGKSAVIEYSPLDGRPNGTNNDNFNNYGGLTAGTGNGAGNLPVKTGWVNDTLADMNGDGKPDMVWRNYDTTGADAGKTIIWFMDKEQITSKVTLATRVIDPNWHIVGAGDFDGDGKADLAWANYATKTVSIWYMSGGNTTDLVSYGFLKLNATDTNTAIIPDGWRIQAVGDMNNNGRAELIWRQITGTGSIAFWSINSAMVNATSRNVYLDTANSQVLSSAYDIPDQAFHIYGAGSLGSDNKTDLVWANNAPANNAPTNVYVWNMDNTTRLSYAIMETFPGNLSPWKISGLGDMDNDGKLDLVYKYYGTGQAYLICPIIPAANSPLGIQPVNVAIGTETPVAKGTALITGTAPVVIGQSNLTAGTCTGAVVGATSTCRYPLTNSGSGNIYALPTTPITVTVPGSPVSQACVIGNNGTSTAELVCNSVPTTGATPGTKSVPTSLGGSPTASLVLTAPIPTTIGLTNLVAGTCTSVVTASLTTCEYPLTGDANNNYTLPTSPITVTVPGSTTSPACILVNNGTTGAKLVCNNVPTTGATAGTKQVPTSLGASPAATLVLSTVPPTTITASNLTNGMCNPGSVSLGTTTTCEYPLTGDTNNNYTLPNTGIKAQVPGATNPSDACTLTNNGTTGAKLTCSNVPTAGTGLGQTNVPTTLGGTAVATLTVVASGTTSTVALKVMLAGAFDGSTSMMKTTLNTKNLVPMMQPYNDATFGYTGTEMVTTMPTDAVDWVLVELRQGTTTITKKAGLLLASGNIIDVTSTSGIVFNNLPTASYQVIVRHRNHLAVATNTPISLIAGQGVTLDMTDNSNVKGANQTMLKTGVYGMRLANTNGNNAINASDRTISRQAADANNIYRQADVNMDGIVNSQDRTLSRLANEAIEVI